MAFSLLCVFFLILPTFSFTPCPLLGPAYPPFTLDNNALTTALGGLQNDFDQLVRDGNSSHGSISSSSSFSLALFSTNPGTASSNPFFFEYHHTAIGEPLIDKNSVYPIGGLTKVFTVWALLLEAGDYIWGLPVSDHAPELRERNVSDPLRDVDWASMTVGQLASHMAGISRGPFSTFRSRKDFFEYLIQQDPVTAPGTTPSYSHNGFRILGYIIERIARKSFASVLSQRILQPLRLKNTSLGANSDSAFSMLSTITDLSSAGKSILSASLLSKAQTNRWLKPVAHTSNPANSLGYPWVIYKGGNYPNTSLIEIYTALSSEASHSSYIGLVPSFNVGFSILAVDNKTATDLNPHTGLIGDALLPALTKIAINQASANFGGVYTSPSNSSLKISADSLPGLFIDTWIENGTDFRETLAGITGIKASSISIRLYPMQLEHLQQKQSFRAVFQDKDEFADFGTPTCVSWMNVDNLKYKNASARLDQFIFELDSRGKAVMVEVPALNRKLRPISQ